MKKIVFTLLFVILFTQIQNSYWKCISYDPETNWCLLTDWTEDEEKKETQVNKTWWYREKLWFNNEEEYLKSGYIPGNMTESDYVNMIMWWYWNEKNYISFDKANVYKNFQNYKLIFLWDPLKNLESYTWEELDEKIDKVVKEIEKREKVLKAIALKIKKDKSNNDLKNQAKTIWEEILWLKLLFWNHYWLCTVYGLSGDENKLKMCYVDYKKKKTRQELEESNRELQLLQLKAMQDEKWSIFNLYLKKDINDISYVYNSIIYPWVSEWVERYIKNYGSLDEKTRKNAIDWILESLKDYIIEWKEEELRKFLDNEITIISTKWRDFSHITLKSKIYLTTKLEKQILSMLAKIKDLQERHSYVVELLKKIDIKFVNETNFQKKLLFRELKIFLEKEEINILNQIDKTK